MKTCVKLCIVLIVLCDILTLLPTQAYAAEKPIYGLNCGIPGEPGKDRCCVDTFEPIKAEEPQGVGGWLLERIPFVGGLFKKKRKLEKEFKSFKEANTGDKEDLCPGSKSDIPVKEQDAQGNITSCTCVEEESPQAQQLMPGQGPAIGMCNTGYYDQRDQKQVDEQKKCQKCVDNKGYWSALGCISFDFGTLVSTIIIDIGLLLGGAFVLLCIIYNAIVFQISRGDAQKVQKARENMVSCILGLILIIFSVFILKIIGYTVGDIFDFKIDSVL